MQKATDSIRGAVRRADLLLLALCVVASGCGVVLIYSATRYMGSNRSVIVQIASVLAGILLYFIFSQLDIEHICEKTWKWMAGGEVLIVLLLIPFGTGENTTGNRNWIALPFLPINLQPAEIAKLFFVLLMAYHCAKLHERQILHRVTSLLQLAVHTAFMCGLIAAVSGDFGMALVYFGLFLLIAFTAGVKLRWFALGLAVLAGGLVAVWGALPNYIKMRFEVVLNHDLDPLNMGWQQGRSILAIGSGGLFGRGFLQGTQTQNGAIPANYTDEIFAVCGEEFGLIGCLVVILLLFAIILRCIQTGRKARSPLCAFIAMGFGGMLLLQMAFNIGMCLYIFPVVGLTLPFFSSGGTSILTLFVAMGIVSSIRMRPLPSWLKDRTQFR